MPTVTMERSLTAWLHVVPQRVQRLVSLLSVAVAVDPADVAWLYGQVWPDDAVDDHAPDVARITASPFFAHGSSGLALREDVATTVAARFLEADREAFEQAHTALLDHEADLLATIAGTDGEARAPDGTDQDQWAIRSRMAFYLAALDPEESEHGLSEAFSTVDIESTRVQTARVWLSRLGLRQTYLLGEDSRSIQFLQGFVAHTSGRRDEATSHFTRVLEGRGAVRDSDVYDAIAGHLWAVAQPFDSAAAEDELRRAIDASRDLGLAANEVMARNSLVYRLLETRDIAQSDVLAAWNLERATQIGDDYLTAWCLQTAAVCRREAGDALGALELGARAVDLARSTGDLDTETLAVNERARALGQLGDRSEAARVVQAFVSGAGAVASPEASRRLLQTLGSLRRRATADEQAELGAVMTAVERWQRSR